MSARLVEIRARLETSLAPAVVATLEELVAELVAERVSAATSDIASPWFALDEAAVYVGVSKRTLERLIAKGRVRSTTIGRRRLLHRDDLDALAKAATGEDVAPTTSPRRRR